MKKWFQKFISWVIQQAFLNLMRMLKGPNKALLQDAIKKGIKWGLVQSVSTVKETLKNNNSIIQEESQKIINNVIYNILPPIVQNLEKSQKDTVRNLLNQSILRHHLMEEWIVYVKPHLHTAVINPPDPKKYAFEYITVPGMFLEFGVGLFFSIRYFSSLLSQQYPGDTIYGFDTFEGLPEDWTGTAMFKGGFKTQIPDNLPENISLIKGNILDTFDDFLDQHTDVITFMHLDLDLYNGTKHALDTALQKHRIVPGTILLFDEFFGNLGCAMHERRAFHDWIPQLSDYGLSYKFIGFSYEQAIVLITKAV